jgi:hypothetical protein
MKLFSFFFFALISFQLAAQGLTPEQMVKLDSLRLWIDTQVKSGKPLDQKKLDSMNLVIRNMKPKNTVPDSLFSTNGKEIVKQTLAGGAFTVPNGKKWTVTRIYVNDGGSYNVLVTSMKFPKPLLSGEKIQCPSWCAEGELLNKDQVSMNYIFKIIEEDLK